MHAMYIGYSDLMQIATQRVRWKQSSRYRGPISRIDCIKDNSEFRSCLLLVDTVQS